jgi:hypothetical protein
VEFSDVYLPDVHYTIRHLLPLIVFYDVTRLYFEKRIGNFLLKSPESGDDPWRTFSVFLIFHPEFFIQKGFLLTDGNSDQDDDDQWK